MLRPNDRIEKYEIRERLATGGMGTLYLAHDTTLDRTVALKLFHGDLDRPNARDEFRREARAIAALDHPNIVIIYDYGEHLSHAYLVMEHIRGETLAEVIRRKPPEIPVVVRLGWMVELCAAVGSAHAKGIIHRDIKPANLMIDSYGRLKVLDFGIARMRGSVASYDTARLATAGYVAPEQMRGGEIDARSDVFSIGVVCYELLSYTEPFGAGTDHATTHRVLNEDPLRLDVVEPRVDGELAAIVHRALARDAAARFQTVDALRDALLGVKRRIEVSEPETLMAAYVPATSRTTSGTSEPRTTGSTGDAVSPTPGRTASPRRTTRELLQRQVHDLLELAREHRQAGDLTEARAACLQALRLLPDDVAAVGMLRELDPPADPGGTLGSAAADGATVLVPRPDPGRASPASADSTMLVLDPAPVGAESARTVLAPSRSSGAVSPPAVTSPAPAPPPKASPVPARGARRPVWQSPAAIALAGLLVVGGAVAVWVATRTPAPAPQVPVIVDAAPWATVVSVARPDGGYEALPAEASTPLSLSLAPGTYRVTLSGPPPESETREVTLDVREGGSSNRLLERFAQVDVDDYFRRHATMAEAPAPAPPSQATP